MAATQVPRKNLFDILIEDHRNISRLMGDIKSAAADEKEGLFDQLDTELTRHMDMEEQYLYPELESMSELSEIMAGSHSDHESMKDLLQRMASQEIDSDEWLESLEFLEDTKEIHVHTEERGVFIRAAQKLGEAKIDSLTEEMAAEKQKGPQPPKVRRPQRREPRAEM